MKLEFIARILSPQALWHLSSTEHPPPLPTASSPSGCCTTDSHALPELAGPLLAFTVSWPEEMVYTVLAKPTKLGGNFSPAIMIQISMSP